MLDLLVKITLARASLRQHRHELPFHCHLRDDRARYSDTISRCQTKEPWKGTAWNSLDHVNPATPHSSSSEASCIVYEMVLCRKHPRTTLPRPSQLCSGCQRDSQSQLWSPLSVARAEKISTELLWARYGGRPPLCLSRESRSHDRDRPKDGLTIFSALTMLERPRHRFRSGCVVCA